MAETSLSSDGCDSCESDPKLLAEPIVRIKRKDKQIAEFYLRIRKAWVDKPRINKDVNQAEGMPVTTESQCASKSTSSTSSIFNTERNSRGEKKNFDFKVTGEVEVYYAPDRFCRSITVSECCTIPPSSARYTIQRYAPIPPTPPRPLLNLSGDLPELGTSVVDTVDDLVSELEPLLTADLELPAELSCHLTSEALTEFTSGPERSIADDQIWGFSDGDPSGWLFTEERDLLDECFETVSKIKRTKTAKLSKVVTIPYGLRRVATVEEDFTEAALYLPPVEQQSIVPTLSDPVRMSAATVTQTDECASPLVATEIKCLRSSTYSRDRDLNSHKLNTQATTRFLPSEISPVESLLQSVDSVISSDSYDVTGRPLYNRLHYNIFEAEERVVAIRQHYHIRDVLIPVVNLKHSHPEFLPNYILPEMASSQCHAASSVVQPQGSNLDIKHSNRSLPSTSSISNTKPITGKQQVEFDKSAKNKNSTAQEESFAIVRKSFRRSKEPLTSVDHALMKDKALLSKFEKKTVFPLLTTSDAFESKQLDKLLTIPLTPVSVQQNDEAVLYVGTGTDDSGENENEDICISQVWSLDPDSKLDSNSSCTTATMKKLPGECSKSNIFIESASKRNSCSTKWRQHTTRLEALYRKARSRIQRGECINLKELNNPLYNYLKTVGVRELETFTECIDRGHDIIETQKLLFVLLNVEMVMLHRQYEFNEQKLQSLQKESNITHVKSSTTMKISNSNIAGYPALIETDQASNLNNGVLDQQLVNFRKESCRIERSGDLPKTLIGDAPSDRNSFAIAQELLDDVVANASDVLFGTPHLKAEPEMPLFKNTSTKVLGNAGNGIETSCCNKRTRSNEQQLERSTQLEFTDQPVIGGRPPGKCEQPGIEQANLDEIRKDLTGAVAVAQISHSRNLNDCSQICQTSQPNDQDDSISVVDSTFPTSMNSCGIKYIDASEIHSVPDKVVGKYSHCSATPSLFAGVVGYVHTNMNMHLSPERQKHSSYTGVHINTNDLTAYKCGGVHVDGQLANTTGYCSPTNEMDCPVRIQVKVLLEEMVEQVSQSLKKELGNPSTAKDTKEPGRHGITALKPLSKDEDFSTIPIELQTPLYTERKELELVDNIICNQLVVDVTNDKHCGSTPLASTDELDGDLDVDCETSIVNQSWTSSTDDNFDLDVDLVLKDTSFYVERRKGNALSLHFGESDSDDGKLVIDELLSPDGLLVTDDVITNESLNSRQAEDVACNGNGSLKLLSNSSCGAEMHSHSASLDNLAVQGACHFEIRDNANIVDSFNENEESTKQLKAQPQPSISPASLMSNDLGIVLGEPYSLDLNSETDEVKQVGSNHNITGDEIYVDRFASALGLQRVKEFGGQMGNSKLPKVVVNTQYIDSLDLDTHVEVKEKMNQMIDIVEGILEPETQVKSVANHMLHAIDLDSNCKSHNGSPTLLLPIYKRCYLKSPKDEVVDKWPNSNCAKLEGIVHPLNHENIALASSMTMGPSPFLGELNSVLQTRFSAIPDTKFGIKLAHLHHLSRRISLKQIRRYNCRLFAKFCGLITTKSVGKIKVGQRGLQKFSTLNKLQRKIGLRPSAYGKFLQTSKMRYDGQMTNHRGRAFVESCRKSNLSDCDIQDTQPTVRCEPLATHQPNDGLKCSTEERAETSSCHVQADHCYARALNPEFTWSEEPETKTEVNADVPTLSKELAGLIDQLLNSENELKTATALQIASRVVVCLKIIHWKLVETHITEFYKRAQLRQRLRKLLANHSFPVDKMTAAMKAIHYHRKYSCCVNLENEHCPYHYGLITNQETCNKADMLHHRNSSKAKWSDAFTSIRGRVAALAVDQRKIHQECKILCKIPGDVRLSQIVLCSIAKNLSLELSETVRMVQTFSHECSEALACQIQDVASLVYSSWLDINSVCFSTQLQVPNSQFRQDDTEPTDVFEREHNVSSDGKVVADIPKAGSEIEACTITKVITQQDKFAGQKKRRIVSSPQDAVSLKSSRGEMSDSKDDRNRNNKVYGDCGVIVAADDESLTEFKGSTSNSGILIMKKGDVYETSTCLTDVENEAANAVVGRDAPSILIKDGLFWKPPLLQPKNQGFFPLATIAPIKQRPILIAVMPSVASGKSWRTLKALVEAQKARLSSHSHKLLEVSTSTQTLERPAFNSKQQSDLQDNYQKVIAKVNSDLDCKKQPLIKDGNFKSASPIILKGDQLNCSTASHANESVTKTQKIRICDTTQNPAKPHYQNAENLLSDSLSGEKPFLNVNRFESLALARKDKNFKSDRSIPNLDCDNLDSEQQSVSSPERAGKTLQTMRVTPLFSEKLRGRHPNSIGTSETFSKKVSNNAQYDSKYSNKLLAEDHLSSKTTFNVKDKGHRSQHSTLTKLVCKPRLIDTQIRSGILDLDSRNPSDEASSRPYTPQKRRLESSEQDSPRYKSKVPNGYWIRVRKLCVPLWRFSNTGVASRLKTETVVSSQSTPIEHGWTFRCLPASNLAPSDVTKISDTASDDAAKPQSTGSTTAPRELPSAHGKQVVVIPFSSNHHFMTGNSNDDGTKKRPNSVVRPQGVNILNCKNTLVGSNSRVCDKPPSLTGRPLNKSLSPLSNQPFVSGKVPLVVRCRSKSHIQTKAAVTSAVSADHSSLLKVISPTQASLTKPLLLRSASHSTVVRPTGTRDPASTRLPTDFSTPSLSPESLTLPENSTAIKTPIVVETIVRDPATSELALHSSPLVSKKSSCQKATSRRRRRPHWYKGYHDTEAIHKWNESLVDETIKLYYSQGDSFNSISQRVSQLYSIPSTSGAVRERLRKLNIIPPGRVFDAQSKKSSKDIDFSQVSSTSNFEPSILAETFGAPEDGGCCCPLCYTPPRFVPICNEVRATVESIVETVSNESGSPESISIDDLCILHKK